MLIFATIGDGDSMLGLGRRQGRNMSNYCNYHVIIWPVFSQVQNKIITQNYSFERGFFAFSSVMYLMICCASDVAKQSVASSGQKS